MADATAKFFDELARREHEPLLAKATGSVRFDLTHGQKTDHWLVTINRGAVSVARRKSAADCTLGMDKALFDRIVTGEANAMTAVLRGAASVTGDPELLVLVQRLMPGPRVSPGRNRGDESEASQR